MIVFLFIISLVIPVYTYILFPFVLLVFKKRPNGSTNDVDWNVSVCVIGDNPEEKIKSISKEYPEIEQILGFKKICEIKQEILKKTVVITDSESRLETGAIKEILSYFSKTEIGCVIGVTKGISGDGQIWKYENTVNSLESKIGCTTSGNNSLFAVRKEFFPTIKPEIVNPSFYIVTELLKKKIEVVYGSIAITKVERNQKTFKQKCSLCMGYWQILPRCIPFIIPSIQSFIYISHRVFKWFVFINLITLFVCTILLRGVNICFAVLLYCQLIGYILSFAIISLKLNTYVPKPLNILVYYIEMNLAYFVGFFMYLKGLVIRKRN